MTQLEPIAAAGEAGLVYVSDALPGITRERRGNGWVYLRPDGTVIDDPGERARIAAIGIPPAWSHVWISPVPNGHILATGRDARRRKQYRATTPAGGRSVDGNKYHRMAGFARALPDEAGVSAGKTGSTSGTGSPRHPPGCGAGLPPEGGPPRGPG